ncbi:polysaccharide biosynthesis tyrosine autokinase [Uruburuella testudinis]|uniref:Polysaccharide biosynthesis tyrosine autokinase n=1 Tax=Uruburuella testudinis TaxID=1282863 RepID=A0ABY4DTK0_9NEIS|nr:polysaccharide biosynthesis tyrosine autokinase [Uruburuella testudinis]UOO82369.1 polysaccharide biosynthesis tyrosine autokinase [Uruburuella testudinis]
MAKQYPTPTQNNDGGGEIDLGQQLRNLLDHKYPIALAILLGGLAGAAYSLTSTPVYRANGMLEIETKQNQILTEINSLFTSEPSPSEAEIELVQSRLVVGKTVDDLQLDQVIVPKYFPLIGNMLHNLSSDVDPELTLQTFEVQQEWLNKPIILTALNNKSYSLELPDDSHIEGQVGQPLKINPNTTIQVNQILADDGQQFVLVKNSKLSAIAQVNQNLSVMSKGKTSPIINLGYTGTDPEKISLILNSIIDNYVSQNRDRDVQMAANGLAFISEELPRLKNALEDAENRLNEYRTRSGSLDIPVEAKGALESLIDIESQITTLRTEEAGLAELYTREHPSYKAVLDKLAVLERAKNRINRQIADLPNTQQEVIRLTRDVETNQTTYMQLLGKQQELNIMKASAQGNVRVVDHAVTAEEPVAPRKKMITLLAALTAGTLAAAWYLLRSATRPRINDPQEIEAMGLNVSAIVPLSPNQQKQDNMRRKLKSATAPAWLLAAEEPADMAIEAIRSLRTNLYFSIMEAANKVLMITGATPEAGKSFISANLAAVMAQSDKKVLLIDCDMRRGYLNRLFGTQAEQGLADILSGKLAPAQAIQPTPIANLSLISHGSQHDNPSELLMDHKLHTLIEWARQQFDYVILDTPPILSVTDASIIGQQADSSLMVVHQNKTTPRELDSSLTRLTQSNIHINGVVFNGMARNAQDAYHYYAYAKYSRKKQS